MVAAVAGNTFVDAGLAQVEVAILAGGAVVMDIRDGLLAVVAADGESSGLNTSGAGKEHGLDRGAVGGALDGKEGLGSNAGSNLLAGNTQLKL